MIMQMGGIELKGLKLAAGALVHQPGRSGTGKPVDVRQRGFIITLELVLVMTILGIGLFVGAVAIRDAMFKYAVQKQSEAVYVFDQNGTVLGKAETFDEHEAPIIPYIDRTTPPLAPDPGHANFRAFIGVRDDRFTSRQRVFYTEDNCARGFECIAPPSAEAVDSMGLDALPGTGAVGYLHALQAGPSYAIGAGDSGLPGWLFRETASACSSSTIKSVWTSQAVVAGDPCEYAAEAVVCSGDFGGPSCNPDPVNPKLPACVNQYPTTPSCGCPAGWSLQPAISPDRCCPPGSVAGTDAGQCDRVISNLQAAESVPHPDAASANALQGFTPPFVVNLPTDPDSWESVAPDGVEGELP